MFFTQSALYLSVYISVRQTAFFDISHVFVGFDFRFIYNFGLEPVATSHCRRILCDLTFSVGDRVVIG